MNALSDTELTFLRAVQSDAAPAIHTLARLGLKMAADLNGKPPPQELIDAAELCEAAILTT